MAERGDTTIQVLNSREHLIKCSTTLEFMDQEFQNYLRICALMLEEQNVWSVNTGIYLLKYQFTPVNLFLNIYKPENSNILIQLKSIEYIGILACLNEFLQIVNIQCF